MKQISDIDHLPKYFINTEQPVRVSTELYLVIQILLLDFWILKQIYNRFRCWKLEGTISTWRTNY